MLEIKSMNVHPHTKEELLPEFHENFPYIMTKPLFSYIEKNLTRWHWHNALELFYMEKGSLTYYTPSGKFVFHEGCGGLVNSNILHMTKTISDPEHTIQYLHIFDPLFLAGTSGNLIDEKYISILTMQENCDIIKLTPEDSTDKIILEKIKNSFSLSFETFGFELKIRSQLSEIWIDLLQKFNGSQKTSDISTRQNDRIKQMLSFIFEHFSESVSIRQIADAGFCSERECYRIFQNYLHTTPNEYLINYRLQKACDLLRQTNDPITDISHFCGFGSSSYFGRIFKEHLGCTPSDYRKCIIK